MRVLVVEDDPGFRRLLERYFPKRGVEVVALGSFGAARRALAADASFDVVLTDLNLPDGRGPEVLQGWPHEAPRPSLVVMTGAGHVPKPDVSVLEVLRKPFPLPAIDAVLARLPARSQ